MKPGRGKPHTYNGGPPTTIGHPGQLLRRAGRREPAFPPRRQSRQWRFYRPFGPAG